MILSNKGAMNKRDRYGGQAGGEGNKKKKKKKVGICPWRMAHHQLKPRVEEEPAAIDANV
jgi:hypothetical protein